MSARPWSVGKRYGNQLTEVVDASGEVVCFVRTHVPVRPNPEGGPVEYRPTAEGQARLQAVLEAGR